LISIGLFGKKTKMLKCHVKVVKKNNKVKECGLKFPSLAALERHTERSHGGAGREL